MLDLLFMEKEPELFKFFYDLGVALKDVHAPEEFNVLNELALFVDRRIYVEPVFDACLVVLFAVSRRRMDRAGARIVGDVISIDDKGLPVDEGMLEGEPFQSFRPYLFDHLMIPDARPLRDVLDELLEDDVYLFPRIDSRVGEIRVDGDGEVRRERPWRCGPDEHIDGLVGVAGKDAVPLFSEGKFNVDRVRSLVVVFDLCLGKGRHAAYAPVDRLLFPVDLVPFEEFLYLLDDRCLVSIIHCDVGMLPVADDAEPFEFGALDVDEPCRVLSACVAGLQLGHGDLLCLELLFDLVLDGQPVAVPARDVIRPVACHELRFDDNVLQYLVEGCAEVDIPVRVGRAVVEDERRGAFARLDEFPVELYAFPECEHLLFFDRKVSFHGKRRLRQVQRVFVVHMFCLSFINSGQRSAVSKRIHHITTKRLSVQDLGEIVVRSRFDAFLDEIDDLLFLPPVEMGCGDDLEVLVDDLEVLVECEEVIEGGDIIIRPSDEIDLFAEGLQVVAFVDQEGV